MAQNKSKFNEIQLLKGDDPMLIEVKQLVKRYKELIALDHFNFNLKEGEIVGLLGPNGSGKTTLINCMLGLLKYDKGDIEIFGRPMSPNDLETKSQIGVVPQELALFDKLTVKENIDYFCGLYVENSQKRRELVKEAIAFTGLEGYEKFNPRKLSGGLRRRLNIACGIAHKPRLLFLDEPTVAVDAQSRNFILEGVQRMNREGTSIVYTTHYLEEAQQICRRIVIMDKGKNIVTGTLEELLALINTAEIVHIHLVSPSAEALSAMRGMPHLLEMKEAEAEGAYILKFEKSGESLARLLELIKEHQLAYTQLYSERPTLNDVFLELTGKELRD